MSQNLSNLPVGAKVKFGKYSVNGETASDIAWIITAKNHSGYPSGAITLLSDRVIDFRAFDAKESTNPSTPICVGGNGRYDLSNIAQWLNDNESNWWTASYQYDAEPNSTNQADAPYSQRPGFLNAFSDDERDIILRTSVEVRLENEYDDINYYVFLPSAKEVSSVLPSGFYVEGETWEYFQNHSLTEAVYATAAAVANSTSTEKPANTSTVVKWKTRTWGGTSRVKYINPTLTDTQFAETNAKTSIGVRPALNLPSSAIVTDTTDADGCYKVIFNDAPSTPSTINVPSTIRGGVSNTISWSASTDPEGDTISYVLECAYNSGAFSTIYTGAGLTYSHLVTRGQTTIQYRVKAVDAYGNSSGYATSQVRNIDNNQVPTISGSDGDLGVKTSGFTQTYTVNDADLDSVTVVEAIDNVQVRTYSVTLGATNTFTVSGNTWLALLNGSHTMTITATDAQGGVAVRTYTFTKNVTTLVVQNTTPMTADSMPTRAVISVVKNIAPGATFKVEVCNNGFDASPTFEDCTNDVLAGLVHVFTNTSKTASNWGVIVKVTVNRNGASGSCYINSIGGNFA